MGVHLLGHCLHAYRPHIAVSSGVWGPYPFCFLQSSRLHIGPGKDKVQIIVASARGHSYTWGHVQGSDCRRETSEAGRTEGAQAGL